MPPTDRERSRIDAEYDRYRIRKANTHYIIAGILCVVGFFFSISVALAAIGVPMLLIGLIWFAVAHWVHARRAPYRVDRR
jgi:predicted membrane channel-forming protein YqfA (hemolysin III family)